MIEFNKTKETLIEILRNFQYISPLLLDFHPNAKPLDWKASEHSQWLLHANTKHGTYAIYSTGQIAYHPFVGGFLLLELYPDIEKDIEAAKLVCQQHCQLILEEQIA